MHVLLQYALSPIWDTYCCDNSMSDQLVNSHWAVIKLEAMYFNESGYDALAG